MIHLPLWLPSLVGIALCLGFAFRTWRLRPWQGWRWAVIAGLAVAWWCAGQFGWYLTEGVAARRLMGKLQYLGITTTPVAWLLMALEYTGRRSWLAGRRRRLLLAVPFATRYWSSRTSPTA